RAGAGDGGANGGAFVGPVPGHGTAGRTPAQRDRATCGAGDGRSTGYPRRVGATTRTVQAHIVGVVGALSVPAVQVDLHTGLAGGGGELHRQLGVAGRRRGPGGRPTVDPEVGIVTADPGRQ